MQKNVLLFTGSLKNGGAERSIIRLATALSKKHNVILVVTDAKDSDYHTDVPIIEIKELKKKITKLYGVYKLRKIKKQYKIDTSISYMTSFNFYNVLSKYKDKTIISIRNHMSSKNEGIISTLMQKISIKFCDLVVCCSYSVMRDQLHYNKIDINKIKVITNFCDLEEIQKGLKGQKNEQKNYFVTMGRLTTHKGIQHIINAMKYVVELYPDVKLMILGRGPLKLDLAILTKKLKLQKNIIFMDFNSNPYIFLKESKGFILASYYEGFPNSIIEAMATGAPIIATDAPGGSREILMENATYDDNSVLELTEAEYGLLIPKFSEKQDKDTIIKNERILADAMLLLLNDNKKAKHYHEKSLERIKKYTEENIIKLWLEVI